MKKQSRCPFFAIIIICMCIFHGAKIHSAEDKVTAGEPPLTPRLQLLAEFATKTRCPVYESAEPVSLWVAIAGRRTSDEKLIWNVNDY
ncbi:MAG: hypothetical protein WCP55_11575, partial [Lentisphaerota bacterium]